MINRFYLLNLGVIPICLLSLTLNTAMASTLSDRPQKSNCFTSLGKVTWKITKAPIVFAFGTKKRAAISMIATTAYIAPVYPTDEGMMSPAMHTWYRAHDYFQTLPENPDQGDDLRRAKGIAAEQNISEAEARIKIAERNKEMQKLYRGSKP